MELVPGQNTGIETGTGFLPIKTSISFGCLRIKEVLEKSGMLESKIDDAIFYWFSNWKLEGLLYCQVDDFYVDHVIVM